MTNRELIHMIPRSAGVPIPPGPSGPELPQPGGVPLPEPEHEPWQDPSDPFRKVNRPPERPHPGIPIESPEPSLPA